MSQRLLISLKKNITEEDDFYDGIYTEESTVNELLLNWCDFNPQSGFYLGPWKITIRDKCLFDQFMEDFKKLKKWIPQLKSLKDCWAVFDEKGNDYWNEEINKEMKNAVNEVIKEINKEEK